MICCQISSLSRKARNYVTGVTIFRDFSMSHGKLRPEDGPSEKWRIRINIDLLRGIYCQNVSLNGTYFRELALDYLSTKEENGGNMHRTLDLACIGLIALLPPILLLSQPVERFESSASRFVLEDWKAALSVQTTKLSEKW